MSWPYAVLAIASLLFGGHGLFLNLSKNRKDSVVELMRQVGEQGLTIAKLSERLGNTSGKIELLEKQVAVIRKEKHHLRNLVQKYKARCVNLELDARDRAREAVDRLARIKHLESILKTSPDSPLHALEEPQA